MRSTLAISPSLYLSGYVLLPSAWMPRVPPFLPLQPFLPPFDFSLLPAGRDHVVCADANRYRWCRRSDVWAHNPFLTGHGAVPLLPPLRSLDQPRRLDCHSDWQIIRISFERPRRAGQWTLKGREGWNWGNGVRRQKNKITPPYPILYLHILQTGVDNVKGSYQASRFPLPSAVIASWVRRAAVGPQSGRSPPFPAATVFQAYRCTHAAIVAAVWCCCCCCCCGSGFLLLLVVWPCCCRLGDEIVWHLARCTYQCGTRTESEGMLPWRSSHPHILAPVVAPSDTGASRTKRRTEAATSVSNTEREIFIRRRLSRLILGGGMA